MDVSTLFSDWIIPISALLGACVFSGFNLGAAVLVAAIFVNQSTLVVDSLPEFGITEFALWSDNEMWMVVVGLSVAAMVFAVVWWEWFVVRYRWAFLVRIVGIGAVAGVTLQEVGWLTAMLVTIACILVSLASFALARGVLMGALKGGGSVPILGIFAAFLAAVGSLLSVAVPVLGAVFVLLLIVALLRVRRQSDERYKGLRILA